MQQRIACALLDASRNALPRAACVELPCSELSLLRHHAHAWRSLHRRLPGGNVYVSWRRTSCFVVCTLREPMAAARALKVKNHGIISIARSALGRRPLQR